MCDEYSREIARSLRSRIVNKHKSDVIHEKAAVVLIIKKSTDNYDALFIKRSVNNQDAFSGHMAFPGGKKTIHDDSLLDTAYRETYEEVGIKLYRKSIILGELDDCKPNNPKARNLVVTPFVSYMPHEADVKIDNLEVADYVWVPVNHLYEQYRKNLINYGVEYNKKKFEYDYNDYFIWGLTGRIITQFIELTSHIYEI